jgi:hypothetical protein
MPLIIFSVNTAYLNAAAVQPFGIRPDGSFLLTHRLAYDLPPETNFTLKHVSFAGDGFSGGLISLSSLMRFTPTNRFPNIF